MFLIVVVVFIGPECLSVGIIVYFAAKFIFHCLLLVMQTGMCSVWCLRKIANSRPQAIHKVEPIKRYQVLTIFVIKGIYTENLGNCKLKNKEQNTICENGNDAECTHKKNTKLNWMAFVYFFLLLLDWMLSLGKSVSAWE